jgi:hypothetical protein
MGAEFEDVTGKPRPIRDIIDALRFVEADMMRNPMRMLEGHGPALIHYSVIRDVLREAIATRSET